MIIGARIDERCKAKGWSQAELARRVGVKSTSIWKLVTGQTRDSKHLYRIVEELETTVDYLTGKTDNPGWSEAQTPALSLRNEDRSADLVELDEIDLHYGLGETFIDTSTSAEKRSFSRSWLRNFTHAPPDQLFWSIGVGDSMEPTIRHGEPVLIDRSQALTTGHIGDGIWAIAWGQVGMIKRLRPRSNEQVEILSDNPLIPHTITAIKDLHIIGRVVAIIRKL